MVIEYHNSFIFIFIFHCNLLILILSLQIPTGRYLGLYTGNNIIVIHLVMNTSKICVKWSIICRWKALDVLFRLVLIRICEPVERTTTPVVKLKYLQVGICSSRWGLINVKIKYVYFLSSCYHHIKQ